MTKWNDVNTELGALEAQLEQLMEVESLVDRLDGSRTAAREATRAAQEAIEQSAELAATLDRLTESIRQLDLEGAIGQMQKDTADARDDISQAVEGLTGLDDRVAAIAEDQQEAVDALWERIRDMKLAKTLDRVDDQAKTTYREVVAISNHVEALPSVFNEELDNATKAQKEIVGQAAEKTRTRFSVRMDRTRREMDEALEAVHEDVQKNRTTQAALLLLMLAGFAIIYLSSSA
jgi:uncharacterized phage infection (PIP) family protein YhgE